MGRKLSELVAQVRVDLVKKFNLKEKVIKMEGNRREDEARKVLQELDNLKMSIELLEHLKSRQGAHVVVKSENGQI